MKPMLAVNADINSLRFPYLVSPKLDGVRCLIINGVAYSRNLKPIRNNHIQAVLGDPKLNGFDGEIIVGSPTAKDVYRKTNSAVSRIEGEPNFTFHVFDDLSWSSTFFRHRFEEVCIRGENSPYVSVVPHDLVHLPDELSELETRYVEQGYEGVMLRDPEAIYKFGRATLKENSLLKVKRFSDSEAVVIGFEEQMTNLNEKTISELGNSKRSSHQANMHPAGILGSLVVKDVLSGVEFNIGTGFSAIERGSIWGMRPRYLGQVVSYTHFEVGVKDKPRFPVFKGFRALEAA